ncbi:MAG: hypothetical protein HOV81_28350 [Kofleriaceae bacterium]|nr:hypothetical protein [Kofleriaceae bacterium]
MVATLASAGCTGPCDRAEHSAGLVIGVSNIEASSAYRLEVVADGALLVVNYSVDAEHRLACSDSCEASAGNFVIEPEFGWPLDGTTDARVRFAVHRAHDRDAGPGKLTLRLYRDAQLAYEQQLQPSYRTSEPAGEGCGELAFALVEVAP